MVFAFGAVGGILAIGAEIEVEPGKFRSTRQMQPNFVQAPKNMTHEMDGYLLLQPPTGLAATSHGQHP